MSNRKRKPTAAELGILQVLWARGPSTVREVAVAMGRDGAYTTILKLMQIMKEKGLAANTASSGHNTRRGMSRAAMIVAAMSCA